MNLQVRVTPLQKPSLRTQSAKRRPGRNLRAVVAPEEEKSRRSDASEHRLRDVSFWTSIPKVVKFHVCK